MCRAQPPPRLSQMKTRVRGLRLWVRRHPPGLQTAESLLAVNRPVTHSCTNRMVRPGVVWAWMCPRPLCQPFLQPSRGLPSPTGLPSTSCVHREVPPLQTPPVGAHVLHVTPESALQPELAPFPVSFLQPEAPETFSHPGCSSGPGAPRPLSSQCHPPAHGSTAWSHVLPGSPSWQGKQHQRPLWLSVSSSWCCQGCSPHPAHSSHVPQHRGDGRQCLE